MEPIHLRKLNAARRAREPICVVTNLADGRERLVRRGQVVAGALGEAINETFRTGVARQVDEGGTAFFINPFLPETRLVVIGAVHISQALARLAGIAGYRVEIIDPRASFATPERFEGVPLRADWPEDVFKDQPLDPFTALISVTHDPKIDDPAIVAGLQSDCFYVGALGSRKTHGRRLERLRDAGVSAVDLRRIRAPIGLDIGASGPAEIAVAILAEVIATLRRRDAAS